MTIGFWLSIVGGVLSISSYIFIRYQTNKSVDNTCIVVLAMLGQKRCIFLDNKLYYVNNCEPEKGAFGFKTKIRITATDFINQERIEMVKSPLEVYALFENVKKKDIAKAKLLFGMRD